MSEEVKKEPPFTTTDEGIVIKWKTLVLILVAFFGVTGGTPFLTSYFGIGGSALAEQFKTHEKDQSSLFGNLGDRVQICENAIDIMTKTLKAVETVQRMQVATTEARNLTVKIKNPEEREKQFIRVLEINLKRLGSEPPRETCYTLDCMN